MSSNTTLVVLIEDRINGNPDFAPVGHIGYTACEHFPRSSGWIGCPLGRSATKEGAIADLLARANAESGTNFVRADCEIRDRSEGPKV